jgi:hypothetical protein
MYCNISSKTNEDHGEMQRAGHMRSDADLLICPIDEKNLCIDFYISDLLKISYTEWRE